MDEITKPKITYEVRNEFLYVDRSRYKLNSINSVDTDARYLHGMDDEPGCWDYSLYINKKQHYLCFYILDEDSKEIKVEKQKMLDDLVADIKRLINF